MIFRSFRRCPSSFCPSCFLATSPMTTVVHCSSSLLHPKIAHATEESLRQPPNPDSPRPPEPTRVHSGDRSARKHDSKASDSEHRQSPPGRTNTQRPPWLQRSFGQALPKWSLFLSPLRPSQPQSPKPCALNQPTMHPPNSGLTKLLVATSGPRPLVPPLKGGT